VKTDVLTSADQLFALRTAWEELHSRVAAPVSMSYIWLSTWWNIFGSRFTIRALVGWEGDRLVGLFPCFIESFTFLHLKATRLRFLGEYSVLSEYHPLVDPWFEEEFAEAAADFCIGLMKAGECNFIDFHAFPFDLAFMQRWIGRMSIRPVFMTVRDREVARMRIDLPKTVPEYWALLSPRERGQFRRKERILKASGTRTECVTDPNDTDAFRDYVRLNTTIWEGKGPGSYYVSREGFERFQREVTRALLQSGAARLYFFEQGGKRFAALHAFVMNGVVQAYLGGRDPDHKLARLSPGLVLTVHVIKQAIEDGEREFDFLTGDLPYKYHLGGSVHGWHGRVTACLRGPRGWKGTLLIKAHNAAVAADKSPRLAWIARQFDWFSSKLKDPKGPPKTKP
jgi:CelD/BcsL family acetyltransferase involved in cellulose biosynthesis